MKRAYERILFMVIGALIAFFAYMVGNTDKSVNAHEDGKKLMTCDYLHVKESIMIGKPSKDISILLQVNENNSQFVLKHGKDSENYDNIIGIVATSEAAYIAVKGKDPINSKYPNRPDRLVQMGVAKDDVLGKKASIVLQNDKSTHRITAHGSE